MRKKTVKNIIIIIIGIFIICLDIRYFLKDKIKKSFNEKLLVSKCIIELDCNDFINKKVDENSFPMEYYFFINNYDDKNNINEIDFEYIITLENSNMNFPVKYVLYDCDTNKIIEFSDGKSSIMKLDKNQKKSKKFKLILNWCEKEKILDFDLEIALKVNAVQERLVNNE